MRTGHWWEAEGREESKAQRDAHWEVTDEVQERLLEPHALAERNDGLLEPNSEHRRSRGEREPRPPLLKEEPRQRAKHWGGTTISSCIWKEGGARLDARQTPPENAMSTLNALVLFSVLSSDRSP